MKIKHKPGDFRVRELLDDRYLQESGKHRVYLVTKRKHTSLEAAERLASLANMKAADVSMAGLKDRQGVTSQYMSLPGGKRVQFDSQELKIQPVGSALEPLSPEFSRGNAFDLRLRDLTPAELNLLRANRDLVGRLGVPNYFDEQRFGNLRHEQGWIAKGLMLGQYEAALRRLLCAESPFDGAKERAFKQGLDAAWGEWGQCREIAGRFGQHHSIFEHLRREPRDFRGAFFHVSSRLRLIHLYAWQSHIWNRAVASCFAALCGRGGGRLAESIEGPLVFQSKKLDLDPEWQGRFRLPGDGLRDVGDPEQHRYLSDALAHEGLVPDQFRIEGVSGFQLKGEDRHLFVRPHSMRMKLPERASDPRDTAQLSFELPRGAYATLVVRGLLARPIAGVIDLSAREPRGPGPGDRGRGAPGERGRRWMGENAPPPSATGGTWRGGNPRRDR